MRVSGSKNSTVHNKLVPILLVLLLAFLSLLCDELLTLVVMLFFFPCYCCCCCKSITAQGCALVRTAGDREDTAGASGSTSHGLYFHTCVRVGASPEVYWRGEEKTCISLYYAFLAFLLFFFFFSLVTRVK